MRTSKVDKYEVKRYFFFTDIEWKVTYEVSLKLPIEGFISPNCKFYTE